jgi:NAD(P)H-flavin reductase
VARFKGWLRTLVAFRLKGGKQVIGGELAKAELIKAHTQAEALRDEWHIGGWETIKKLISELKFDQWSKATFVTSSFVVILQCVLVVGWHYHEIERVLDDRLLADFNRETQKWHVFVSVLYMVALPAFFCVDRMLFGTKPFYRALFCWVGGLTLCVLHPSVMGGCCMLVPAVLAYAAWKTQEKCRDFDRKRNPLPVIDGIVDGLRAAKAWIDLRMAGPKHPVWKFKPLSSSRGDWVDFGEESEGTDILEGVYEQYVTLQKSHDSTHEFGVVVPVPAATGGMHQGGKATKVDFGSKSAAGPLPGGATAVIYDTYNPKVAWAVMREKMTGDSHADQIHKDGDHKEPAHDGGIHGIWRNAVREDRVGKIVVVLVWMGINSLLFYEAYKRTEDKIIALQLGLAIPAAPVAKGMGAVLNFNCALIAVPVIGAVLRYLHTARIFKVDRHGYVHYEKTLDHYIPIGKNVTFHRYIAWGTMTFAAIHTIAHFINYGKAAEATYVVFPHYDGVWITGVIIIVCMVIMYGAALETVRRDCFNAFWFSHHLFVVFWGCLLYHGPVFYIWSAFPLIAYFWSRYKRDKEIDCHVILQEMVLEPPDVIKLTMRNEEADRRFDMWPYESGQYVRINCPFIAPLEWHPFTISSAPESGTLTLHIKVTRPGGWTGRLKKFMDGLNVHGHRIFALYNSKQTMFGTTYAKVIDQPLLRIDGPHSAPCQHISEYEHALLFGAGIGLTPFASALSSIVDFRWLRGRDPKNVYLYWSFRMSEFSMYSWFVKLLSTVRARYLSKRLTDRQFFDVNLKINLYATRGFKDEEKESVENLMRQMEPREGYNRLDPIPMTVIRNDPPAGTRKKEFQLKVYEGDTVELIGSCKYENVAAWRMLADRPKTLQRVKLPKGTSAIFYVSGAAGLYTEGGSLPYSPAGFNIAGEDADYIRLESPLGVNAIVPSESPQHSALVEARLPAVFAVKKSDLASPQTGLCFYGQDTESVRNARIPPRPHWPTRGGTSP